jgi:hypothetical protein
MEEGVWVVYMGAVPMGVCFALAGFCFWLSVFCFCLPFGRRVCVFVCVVFEVCVSLCVCGCV